MTETIRYYETLVDAPRLDYGAVPLDPWKAADLHDGVPYATASYRHISEKLSRAMLEASERHWVESPELMANLYEFLEISLYDSQQKRIERNPTGIDGVVADSDERIVRAKNGTATPSELLEILVDYPQLGSVELAKLSHPLDFAATEAMDKDVYGILATKTNGEMLQETPRYKVKRRMGKLDADDDDFVAAIILRKQALMNFETSHGTIQIVQRRSFLVRGDKEARMINDRDLAVMIEDDGNFEELTEKVESYLGLEPDLLQDLGVKWLQPTATSYYAKYVNS